MERIGYIFFKSLYAFVGVIPLRLLYVLSDINSFLLQYIFRYRLNTVKKNLKNSFPDKSTKELNRITRKFYKNLCDVTLESIKGFSLPIDKLTERYKCLNPEVSNEYFNKGQSIIFALSHYANWEWGTQVAGSVFWHDSITFYKPLSNKYIDTYIRKHREARGMTLCSIYQTKFIFRTENRIPRAYFLVSDQSPNKTNKAYWMSFLNQDTACLHGIESYARMFDLPVIYLDIQRVKRGYYTVSFEVLCDNPRDTNTGGITELYMKKLERIIVKKPEDWLWSHRRWKRRRPADIVVGSLTNCIDTSF